MILTLDSFKSDLETRRVLCWSLTIHYPYTSLLYFTGNTSVWHGQSDILVQKSIVKVDIEHVDEEVARCTLADQNDEEADTLDCSNIVGPKSKSQAIAQTIVNAFVESSNDKSVYEKFVPSFLATEKHIRIILYNCKLDVLLLSDELPIWENGNTTLCMETMIFVWVALNNFVNKLDNSAKHLLEKTSECKFKDVVGEAYQIYLHDVKRPCKRESKQRSTLNRPFYKPVERDDIEFIHEIRMELFQATCMYEDVEVESQKKA